MTEKIRAELNPLSRRSSLGLMAGTALATGLGSRRALAADTADVVIVGAGLAGLTIHKGKDFHLLANANLLILGVVAHHLRVFADDSFVGFNDAATAAHQAGVIGTHGLADAVEHEPSGFVRDADVAVKLVRADALFGRSH